MKRIVAAAIKRDGKTVTGPRHYICISRAVDLYGWKTPISYDEQGFVDQNGIFYTREEAKGIAIASKQIPITFTGVLCSEDLFKPHAVLPIWSDMDIV
jgi:hypothetical protein